MNEEVQEPVGAEIVIGSELQHDPLEYIYVTIPAEYVCVYHRILAMLADYGVEMLKDCKATCKDRNSGVIECFNMFNAAVAARHLGKAEQNADNRYNKLAATLIKYIKTKINQIYKGNDNSMSFVFPVDENGQLKAFVSCGERPRFWIDADDGELYEHKFKNGFDEHFRLGLEDVSDEDNQVILKTGIIPDEADRNVIDVQIDAGWETRKDYVVPCGDVKAWYNGKEINLNNAICQYYFDGQMVVRFNDVQNITVGKHEFKCVVIYRGVTGIGITHRNYEIER